MVIGCVLDFSCFGYCGFVLVVLFYLIFVWLVDVVALGCLFGGCFVVCVYCFVLLIVWVVYVCGCCLLVFYV